MAQYNIKENVKKDPDGNIISKTWEIHHKNGKLLKSGILSKEAAQVEVEALDTINELEEASKHIKVRHRTSTPD